MAESLGTAALELEADDSKLGAQLDAAHASAQQKLLETGKFVTKTVSVVAGAIAAGATLAFNEWHDGFEALRVGTGATGKELDGLVASMENVAGKVTAPISEVGTVMAELARRTGLTGPPLEELTTQFVNLDELGMPASIDGVTQAFTLWNVATKDQADTLDELFRASQETGTSIDTITTALVKFAAPLQALGFTLPQSVALLASMSQHGVNTTKAVGGLTKAFATWAKEGKDPQVMLDRLIGKIQGAKTISDATGIAVDVFGTKAGVDLAKAIRGGALSVDDLTKKITTGKDTIETARASTETWMDKLTILKNRVIAATGPYGQFIGVVAGGVAAIGPMIVGIAEAVPLLGKMSKALKITAAAQWLLNAAMEANPIVLIITGLVLLGIAFAVLWKKSQTFRRIVTGVWNAIRDVVLTVISDLLGYYELWLQGLAKILHVAGKMPGPLGAPFRAAADAVDNAIGHIDNLQGKLDSLKSKTIHVNAVVTGLSYVAALQEHLAYMAAHANTTVTVGAGHNAGGTSYWRGGATWVGEREPELLNLPRGSQITPASRVASGALMSGHKQRSLGAVRVIVVGGDRQAISYLQDLDNDHRRSNGGAGIFD